MNLAFLLPAGLAALAAVLLPLLIHLARRSEQRPTVFAALQWLRQKPKPRHRIRFDEWLLLLVRVLLVALLAVLLARPVLFGAASDAPWVAVAPGVELAAAKHVNAPANARWHWLAPGFPALAAAPTKDAPITSLLRELDASLPPKVALIVVVPERLDGVDAQLPTLSRRVDWRVVGATSSAEAARATAASPPALAVRYAPARVDSVRYLRAAMTAWQSSGAPDIAAAGQALSPGAKHLAWLVPGPVPADVVAWVEGGGTVLLDAQASLAGMPAVVPAWRDGDGALLAEGASLGRGRVLRLTRPLAPADMPVLLDGDFPQQLRALFEPAPPAPARARAVDHAPVTGAVAYAQPPRELTPWLLLLIVLVFAIERWLATAARRGVAT
ncbi:BatA domain-containing protein [Lysobacter sp. KIS68-7]|uniref:BatA domain-containing protein n=1 Tax=Lysobacter sp. KIS68-7 TaxID=2904252 RepID=UPI001E5071EA|nr:BatA domain-containing protein [Lysobacter sp. KIS68-7]UHQ18771.1 BatA domain-containing protein [Lysobacter sp. KIS68-7]